MNQSMNGTPAMKTIADMARIYNVSLRTLRFYEDLDLLSPLRIGSARFYGSRDELRIQLILKGKRLGFSLAEIKRLISERQDVSGPAEFDLPKDVINEQIVHLERKRETVAAAIDELKLALTG